MKVLKIDSNLEKKVQQVENLMNSLGVKVQYTCNGLAIEHDGKEYPLVDSESHDTVTEFPRMIEGIRLRVPDDYPD